LLSILWKIKNLVKIYIGKTSKNIDFYINLQDMQGKPLGLQG